MLSFCDGFFFGLSVRSSVYWVVLFFFKGAFLLLGAAFWGCFLGFSCRVFNQLMVVVVFSLGKASIPSDVLKKYFLWRSFALRLSSTQFFVRSGFVLLTT